jgi:phosphatidylserine/phosphatidylglycerophosphate/cardiolipin synthase-like enzyme
MNDSKKKAITGCVVMALLFFLVSCAGLRVDPQEVDEALEKYTDTTLDCSPELIHDCSLDSPLQELADRASAHQAGSSRHFIKFLEYGDDALVARVHLIRSARHSILIQSFIWGKDDTSYFICQELLKAARRGVQVKVLVDQLGLMGKGPRLEMGAVAHKNIEIKIYNPILDKVHMNYLEMLEGALFQFGAFNQRMHNKVMVVDGRIAITGGRNVEDKYFDMDPIYNFKDLDVLVAGRVVRDMERSFLQYWKHELSVYVQDLTDVARQLVGLTDTKPVQDLLNTPVPSRLEEFDRRASDHEFIKHRFVATATEVHGRVDFFADAPGKTDKEAPLSPDTLSAREALFQQARQSLVIQTPYLVFSDFALGQFERLRKENSDLDILISTNSLAATDNFPVYGSSLKQKKRLIHDLDIRIFEFKPVPGDVRVMNRNYDQLIREKQKIPKNILEQISDIWQNLSPGPRTGLHGKSFVVDGRIAWVGSHNFDPRSDNLNTEAALVIWDERAAQALQTSILFDTEPQNSWVVARRWKIPVFSIISGTFESLWRALPAFDVWPFYCCTSFELREQQSPCPSDHPEFYKLYRAVGPYPEMNLNSKEIKTRLFKAWGGWATPIL